MSRELKYIPPDIRQLTRCKLAKRMVRILCTEIDELKMGEEERYYLDRVKDVEDENDVGTGDRVKSAELVDCCIRVEQGMMEHVMVVN